VPAASATAALSEKGSRFIAAVMPAASETEAHQLVAQIASQSPDATHHCWAYRIGFPPVERSSDAGEPRGTAGPPILQVLRGAEMSGVLAVVSRWFGGTLLGKGGLARAYAGVTRNAVGGLVVTARDPIVFYRVEVPVGRRGALLRLIRPPQIELVSEVMDSIAVGLVSFDLRVHVDREPALASTLADLGFAAERRPG
jgi:putative IMPACT (imprinted ancient) family translation regulator